MRIKVSTNHRFLLGAPHYSDWSIWRFDIESPACGTPHLGSEDICMKDLHMMHHVFAGGNTSARTVMLQSLRARPLRPGSSAASPSGNPSTFCKPKLV